LGRAAATGAGGLWCRGLWLCGAREEAGAAIGRATSADAGDRGAWGFGCAGRGGRWDPDLLDVWALR